MVKGEFFGNIPLVVINVTWEGVTQNIECVLDTGSTGFIQVSYDIARQLNLSITNSEPIKLASGQVIGMQTGVVVASVEGISDYVQVNIADSTPLVGIGFLTKFGYKAIVDCKHRTVVLEKAR
jgi:predicted aspartyl protease